MLLLIESIPCGFHFKCCLVQIDYVKYLHANLESNYSKRNVDGCHNWLNLMTFTGGKWYWLSNIVYCENSGDCRKINAESSLLADSLSLAETLRMHDRVQDLKVDCNITEHKSNFSMVFRKYFVLSRYINKKYESVTSISFGDKIIYCISQ